MKVKFTYLAVEDPYVSPKNQQSYYKANLLLESGIGNPKLCTVETDAAGYAALKGLKPASVVDGDFDIKPSFDRKAPVLVFSALSR